MSFIDWNAAALPSAIQGQNTQNQQQAFNLMQQQRGVRALQGVNLGDPGSVNNALTGLLKAGMIDQAKGLTDLAMTRGINTAALPVAQTGLGLALRKLQTYQDPSSNPQPDQQQQPDIGQAHQQILQQGADAVNDLLSYQDPTLRAAAADVYRQKFAQMHVPQQNIDETFGDLSDAGLRQHEAFLSAAAQGNTNVPHPTGFAASQALLNSDPIYRNAQGTLTGPLADPLVQGVLAKYAGIDLGPGIGQALMETGPARTEAAQAAYAPTISQAQAAGSAIGAGSVGSPPVAGARLTFNAQGQPDAWILPNGTTQAIQSAATASALGGGVTTPVTVPTGVPGQTRVESATQFAGGPPATSATAAQVAGAVGGATANTEQATNFENYSAGYNQRKANLDNLRLAARDISTGPQAPFWGHLGALAAEYGIKTSFTPTTNQTAAYEEVQKMAQSVLAQQKDTLGLPNTNQSVNLATGATPHEETSPLGLQRLAGVLEGNEDYINATRQAWERWKGQGHGYETFQQFVPQFMQTFHPQVFQAQYLDPQERAKVRTAYPGGPKRFDAEEAAAQRLGFLAQ